MTRLAGERPLAAVALARIMFADEDRNTAVMKAGDVQRLIDYLMASQDYPIRRASVRLARRDGDVVRQETIRVADCESSYLAGLVTGTALRLAELAGEGRRG